MKNKNIQLDIPYTFRDLSYSFMRVCKLTSYDEIMESIEIHAKKIYVDKKPCIKVRFELPSEMAIDEMSNFHNFTLSLYPESLTSNVFVDNIHFGCMVQNDEAIYDTIDRLNSINTKMGDILYQWIIELHYDSIIHN